MNLIELEEYFDSILHLQNYATDPSKNGVQVQNSDRNAEIKTVAYAVDCCLETVTKAAEINADVLLVHHGIFWNEVERVTGTRYDLLKKIMDSNLAVYAAHIPLDANPIVGNNYGLARKIGLADLEDFGNWKGMSIGVKGRFSSPSTLDDITKILFPDSQKSKPLAILPFGKENIETVGIISGGASEEVEDAIRQNLDLYITGEISHQIYHLCLENKMNFLAGGHYATETVGVSLLAEKLSKDTGIKTVFIDVPTGL